jgi:hypothetical protein
MCFSKAIFPTTYHFLEFVLMCGHSNQRMITSKYGNHTIFLVIEEVILEMILFPYNQIIINEKELEKQFNSTSLEQKHSFMLKPLLVNAKLP